MLSYISIPVADMRERPSRESKVVSQALFGEKVEVGERLGQWVSIATPDGYVGWAAANSIVKRLEPYPKNIEVSRLSAHVYSIADTEYGPCLTLPFGSPLQLLDDSAPRWIKIRLIDEKEAFIQKGDVIPETFDLVSFSKKFLGLPYTWGGRSSFGYDCSGFVQMIYSRIGIQIPRDAREQLSCGKPIAFGELQPGDLIFWGKSEREIRHVGMCLENPLFIHTSSRENKPYLRISQLSDFEWSGHKEAFYPFRTARRLDYGLCQRALPV